MTIVALGITIVGTSLVNLGTRLVEVYAKFRTVEDGSLKAKVATLESSAASLQAIHVEAIRVRDEQIVFLSEKVASILADAERRRDSASAHDVVEAKDLAKSTSATDAAIAKESAK
jgi:hypothetical protein